jgi:hypothetical protein
MPRQLRRRWRWWWAPMPAAAGAGAGLRVGAVPVAAEAAGAAQWRLGGTHHAGDHRWGGAAACGSCASRAVPIASREPRHSRRPPRTLAVQPYCSTFRQCPSRAWGFPCPALPSLGAAGVPAHRRLKASSSTSMVTPGGANSTTPGPPGALALFLLESGFAIHFLLSLCFRGFRLDRFLSPLQRSLRT